MKTSFLVAMVGCFAYFSVGRAESLSVSAEPLVAGFCKCFWEGGLTKPEWVSLIQFKVYGEGNTEQINLGDFETMSACISAMNSSPSCDSFGPP